MPRYCYVLKWRLPDAPASKQLEDATHAAEHARFLLAMTYEDRSRLDKSLQGLRDRICKKHLGWKEDRLATVDLSLLVLDEDLPRKLRPGLRMVCGTYPHISPLRKLLIPWGAGVAGLAMRRREPVFVDTLRPSVRWYLLAQWGITS
jgi:hypothetical protein